MDIQMIEEMQYNPQSELRNAFDQSRMEAQLDDPNIQQELDAGKFVVVMNSYAYCPSTDACMGIRRRLVESFPSRSQADALADKLSQHECDEAWPEVRPQPLHVEERIPPVVEEHPPF